MNKIIIRISLLVFSLAIIFFIQRGMPLLDVLIRSVIASIVISILISGVALIFLKSSNQYAVHKQNNSNQSKQ